MIEFVKILSTNRGQLHRTTKDELFHMKFKGERYKMMVNNKDCIMLT